MQRVALLYDASQTVLSTFDQHEVLERILKVAQDYFRLKNVAILLFDKERSDLRVHLQIGWDQGHDAVRVPLGHAIAGRVAQQQQLIYVPDVSQEPNYISTCRSTRSELAIPLMVRDGLVGVLDCQSENLDHFDAETIDLLLLFSTQASMALQNAFLYSLEQRRAHQLEAINAIAQQTTAVLDVQQLLSKVCSLVQKSFEFDHVSVLLKDDEDLVLRAQHGKLKPSIEDGGRLPLNTGLGKILGAGETKIENELGCGAEYKSLCTDTKSRMFIPLVSFGQTFGVLALESAKCGSFNLSDRQPLESVADICATAIQNAHYVERVKQLAYRDGLTGIFNRRFFELRMTEELERARRFGAVMAVIMIDIDNFKQLNDDFGHPLGDEVLRQVSSLLHGQLRAFDVVCRYGGEEFAILLSETNPEHALGVAEKLRRLVETWPFPGVPRSVTISAGAATFPENGTNYEQLLKAADSGLYAAKVAGRNRALLAGQKPAAARAHTTGQA